MSRRFVTATAAVGLAAVLAISGCSADEEQSSPSTSSEAQSTATTTSATKERDVPKTPLQALKVGPGAVRHSVDEKKLSTTKFRGLTSMQVGRLPIEGNLPERTAGGNPWGLAVLMGGTGRPANGAVPEEEDFLLWTGCNDAVAPVKIDKVAGRDAWILTFEDLSDKFDGATSFDDAQKGGLPVTLTEIHPEGNVCEQVADLKEKSEDGPNTTWGWSANIRVQPIEVSDN